MDVSAASASTAMDTATAASSVAASVLASTQSILVDEMTQMLAALGVGSNVNAAA